MSKLGRVFAMEELDRVCSKCGGTGRARSGDERIDALERAVAESKYQIADLTEAYGLDLRHRSFLPGEVEARTRVGQLQTKLAKQLDELQAARSAARSQDVVCPQCHGKGFVLTESGEQMMRFIRKWIHPARWGTRR
jgi:hypothetical protein